MVFDFWFPIDVEMQIHIIISLRIYYNSLCYN